MNTSPHRLAHLIHPSIDQWIHRPLAHSIYASIYLHLCVFSILIFVSMLFSIYSDISMSTPTPLLRRSTKNTCLTLTTAGSFLPSLPAIAVCLPACPVSCLVSSVLVSLASPVTHRTGETHNPKSD